MHVLSKLPFNIAADRHPEHAEEIIDAWKTLRSYDATTPEELRVLFPSLDNMKYVKNAWVIDIGGNDLRLLGKIYFDKNRMYVKGIYTHKEYDKIWSYHIKGAPHDDWK